MLAALHGKDFFLDGILRDQLEAVDGALLPDPVRPVGGLRLDGRVPPRVEMDHHVGPGKIQARAAGLETDQEHGD